MFDSSLRKFKLARDASDSITYWENVALKGMTDVSSFDPCYLPEYYWEFYYVPCGERKYKRQYNELNEIRRVLDYPFYYESVDIDDIMSIPKDLRVSKNKEKTAVRLAIDLWQNDPEENDSNFNSREH